MAEMAICQFSSSTNLKKQNYSKNSKLWSILKKIVKSTTERIMSDLKSMMPDFKELGEMTGKLFKDIKNSVCEIVEGYKQKHPDAVKKEKAPASPKAKSEEKPAEKE